jgi:hypothetical protein
VFAASSVFAALFKAELLPAIFTLFFRLLAHIFKTN